MPAMCLANFTRWPVTADRKVRPEPANDRGEQTEVQGRTGRAQQVHHAFLNDTIVARLAPSVEEMQIIAAIVNDASDGWFCNWWMRMDRGGVARAAKYHLSSSPTWARMPQCSQDCIGICNHTFMRSWIKLSNTRSHRHDFDTDDLDFAQIPKGRCPISPIKFLTMWNLVMEVRTWGFAFALIWAPRTRTKSWSGRRFSMKVLHPTRNFFQCQRTGHTIGQTMANSSVALTASWSWQIWDKSIQKFASSMKTYTWTYGKHTIAWRQAVMRMLIALTLPNTKRFFENEVDSTSWFAAGKKAYQFHHVGQARGQNIDQWRSTDERSCRNEE